MAALVAQMCSALNHMHIDCRVMDRNLKPENMLLTEDGLVKICDLGLACAAQTEASMTRRGHAHVHVAREGARQALRLRR